MAKKAAGKDNGRGETVGGYFRTIFDQNPQFLQERSNDEICDRWLADHPGETQVPERIRNILANVKSVMRREQREEEEASPKATRQPRVRAVEALSEEESDTAMTATLPGNEGLEQLEEAIDDCLTLAKNLDRDQLADVIGFLCRARNQVVWKLGE